MNTFAVMGNEIVVWNSNCNAWEPIAHIVNMRQCKHLVRFSQLADDVELLMDKFIGDTAGTSDAKCVVIDSAPAEGDGK